MSSIGFCAFTVQFNTKIAKERDFQFGTFPAIAYTIVSGSDSFQLNNALYCRGVC